MAEYLTGKEAGKNGHWSSFGGLFTPKDMRRKSLEK